MDGTTASMPRTNWAGNLTYSAANLVSPKTVAEAQAAVRAASQIRVVGSRHCFNDIADTRGTHLSLEHLNQVIALDKTAQRVTIEGGIRYAELGAQLHAEGYALHNLASLPHITVAGACATATHGSGARLGNLATAVAAIEFIDGEGNLVRLSRENDPDVFPGTVVSLGALGPIMSLTLDVEPAFNVHQNVYRDLPYDAFEAHFDEIMASGYSVSAFPTWRGDAVEQVWVKSLSVGDTTTDKQGSFFGARSATTNLHPLVELDAANCTEQMGVPGPACDRLPHFRPGSVPAAGGDLQVEYFFPRELAVDVVRTLRGESERLAPLLLISEIRTIAADELWLSPCFGKPCVAFHFSFGPDFPGLMKLLPTLEKALAPFDPCPHWGKLFTLPASRVQAHYPKLDQFRSLLAKHDPAGKFRNDFVNRNIFGGT
jgi:xylitol oxidase